MINASKPQKGVWELIAPDGTMFKADSPLRVCSIERKTRVSVKTQMVRVRNFISLCDLCEKSKAKFIIGKGTQAELVICSDCKNAIFKTPIEPVIII